ncbi:MAG: hypothetical protein GW762_03075 [Candidatus Pacebacteria bacterium]|nr:hypothetical protein [Candidatus Paceibacterota bacterium]PIR63231.1 MAG: hypothetical protein COU64_05950 [Candidatus Pacebacteria bacterium CG10_big_fil_rev_8_21_14_0_10_40_26]PIZ78262.1 MAG: hypothetical protein COY01_05770 [Candidatus Pacebacteria bacterium CG_4_10_14_0_2_um_filter_40_20]PJA68693.1 MAG: hypothetical protein CO156_04275 [Candidatus Pacebacteria bacterium CG_4_9_14_3_um_filter_40_12]PJC41633.1 MAG: hypothetical protein CO041_02865 [Candidatus Pacebacteria bacterium CG_4_9_
MSTYKYLNAINDSGKKAFLTKDLQNLLEIDSKRTLEDLIKRFLDEKILISLEKGKYLLGNAEVSDFEIAQFLYSPSYISFETALNYYGILSQFPVEITSVTTKSTQKKEVLEKMYTYSQISTSLFTGYIKEEDALIALPEKALLDQLYMIAKGLKTKQYLDEMDYSAIDKAKFQEYFKLLPDKLSKSIQELADKYLWPCTFYTS